MKKDYLILTLLYCLPYLINAQEIDVSTNAYVKHFATDTQINDFDIQFSNQPNRVNWSYCITNCGGVFNTVLASPNNVINIGGNLTATFFNDKVTISSSSNLIAGEYPLTIKSNSEQRSYRFIVRKPVQLLYVLDASGSMKCGGGASSVLDWDNCITNAPNRRWDMLDDALHVFLNKLDDHINQARLLNEDEFSVVYFDAKTIDDPRKLIGLDNWNSHNDFLGDINTSMGRVIAPSPSIEGTSIGAGLLRSFNDRYGGVSDSSKRQVLFLFTDGEPNATPHFRVTGGDKYIEDAAGNRVLMLNNNPAINAIEIFTTGIGRGVGFSTLIQELATDSKNYFDNMIGLEADFLDEIPTNSLNQVYDDLTPNVVKSEMKTNSEDRIQMEFVGNKNINQLFFDAYFDQPNGRTSKFIIKKDGEDVSLSVENKYMRRYIGDYMVSFVVDFQYADATLTSEGKWTFECLRAPNNIVKLVTTADDHYLDFKTEINEQPLRTGDKMTIQLDFKYDDKPITDAKVTALILKPGEDINDLLAKTKVSKLENPRIYELSCTEQKYAYLQKNKPELLAKLETPVRKTIKLNHQGKGIYTGTYDDLDVTGTYKVIYSAETQVEEAGFIERMKEQTVNVRYSERGLSMVEEPTVIYETMQGAQVVTKKRLRSKDLNVINTNNKAVLRVRPTYRVGKEERYVGSGFNFGYDVKGKGVKLKEVRDNCDGSYDFELEVDKKNPKLEVTLLEDKLYKGALKNYNTPYLNYQLGLSFHGGVTQPSASLSTHQNGYYGEVDLSYTLSPQLTLEVVGGYYQFAPLENNDELTILGATLYTKGHVSVGSKRKLRIDGGVGVGYYQPKDLERFRGLSFRGGLNYRFSDHFYVLGEVSSFNLSDTDFQFLTYGGGIKIKF